MGGCCYSSSQSPLSNRPLLLKMCLRPYTLSHGRCGYIHGRSTAVDPLVIVGYIPASKSALVGFRFRSQVLWSLILKKERANKIEKTSELRRKRYMMCTIRVHVYTVKKNSTNKYRHCIDKCVWRTLS